MKHLSFYMSEIAPSGGDWHTLHLAGLNLADKLFVTLAAFDVRVVSTSFLFFPNLCDITQNDILLVCAWLAT